MLQHGDREFPTVLWNDDVARFDPHAACPDAGDFRAVVVFAMLGMDFVIADIPGRGWCTPSGRPEFGETPLETAIRETFEEIGGEIRDSKYIGCYFWGPPNEVEAKVPVYVGRVDNFGKLPEGTESRGACLMTLDEIPGRYWRWDPLLEAVFRHAIENAPD